MKVLQSWLLLKRGNLAISTSDVSLNNHFTCGRTTGLNTSTSESATLG